MKARLTYLCSLFAIVSFGPMTQMATAGTRDSTRDSHTPAALEDSTGQLADAFERVSESITPAVVSVESIRKVQIDRPAAGQSPNSESPFERFFGDDFFQFFGRQHPRGFTQEGLGTGVIVKPNGYILTNNHVVEGADEVRVKLNDNRSFPAKVVGTDPETDLAVLKIDANHLDAAPLGNSDDLRVGEWVVAVGNPFGLTSTITAGIVSAKGRAHVGIADYEDFIQTDAAINPGNSGGPLVNLKGQVVGINTAIATKSGGYMGVGFAVPIDMAKSIMTSLIKEGHVVRGWLGVAIQNLNEPLAESFGYDSSKGALIGDVTAGSPADDAGLKAGDIIVRYDGQAVDDVDHLRSEVAETKPQTKVQVEIFRDGRDLTKTVRIGLLKTESSTNAAPEEQPDLGMQLSTLTPDLARQLGDNQDTEGVVVTSVEPLSRAALSGLQTGDVIKSVAGEKVDNVKQFYAALHKHDTGKGVRMSVENSGLQRFVFLRPAQNESK